MSHPTPLNDAIARAVAFLGDRQLASGELATEISTDRAMASDAAFDSSPFTTAIAVYSLGFVAASPGAATAQRAAAVRRRALDFLHAERIPPGLWRYWSARSGKGISPDADDTALISFVLLEAGEGGDLPAANRQLLAANRDRDGIFQTWFRAPGARNDTDSVVNANVLLYLGDGPDTAGAAARLREVASAGEVADSFWYYTTELAFHYALSRAFRHGAASLADVVPALRSQVLARRRPDLSFGDELDTALAACTLLNLAPAGSPTDRETIRAAAGFLLARPQEHGGWRSIAYYQGPEPPSPRTRFFGSAELTTALCLEALARHASPS